MVAQRKVKLDDPLPFQLPEQLQALLADAPRAGSLLSKEGYEAYRPIIFVPGIVSTGLEVWEGDPCAKRHFRERIWGSSLMIRSILLDTQCWLRHMVLNRTTGLDPDGIKLRPASGLEASDYIIGNYWVWAQMIENLAEIGYDSNSLFMAAFDWRLAFSDLEVRDGYFTKLKFLITMAKETNHKRKCVIVTHSMGGLVFFNFMKWVESETGGKGGVNWIEDHIDSFVNVGPPFLGVPKAVSSLISGEMRDTAELAPFINYLRNRLVFSNLDILQLMRSFFSVPSMLPKGGTTLWGNSTFAPDDLEPSISQNETFELTKGTKSNGVMLTFSDGVNFTFNPNTNLAKKKKKNPIVEFNIEESMDLLRTIAPKYMKRIDRVYSYGFAGKDADLTSKKYQDQKYWANVLEASLPIAPSLKIYCLYGVGKDTERAYYYMDAREMSDDEKLEHGSDVAGTIETIKSAVDTGTTDGGGDENKVQYHHHHHHHQHQQPNPQHQHLPFTMDTAIEKKEEDDLPFLIDTTANDEKAKIKYGVKLSNGDGTVPLISLGFMCAKGWKMKRFNPAGAKTIIREYVDNFNLRGFAAQHKGVNILRRVTSIDHVDIMGNYEMISDVLKIVGRKRKQNESEVTKDDPSTPLENIIHSNIMEISNRVDLDV